MGLISPGAENLLDFLQLRQVLSTYDGVDVCIIYAMISFLAVTLLTKVYMGVYAEKKKKEMRQEVRDDSTGVD